MRNDWDGRYKDLVSAALEGTGEVLRGLESGAATQRMDVVFRPNATHRAERLQRGLLGALVDEGECDLEPFRNTPSVGRVRGCVRRAWTYHHVHHCNEDDARAEDAVTRVVVLSPGTPTSAIETWAMQPHPTLPRGVYVTKPGVGLWIVAIAELPATRETLAPRLMGRGPVLKQALRELGALPAGAWEHKLTRILLRWRQEVATTLPRSEEDEEFMETTHETFEQWEERIRRESLRDGRQQGLRDGRQEGLQPLQHQFARRLGRTLTAAEQATLLGRFDTVGPDRLGDVVLDLTPDALAAWLADPDAR